MWNGRYGDRGVVREAYLVSKPDASQPLDASPFTHDTLDTVSGSKFEVSRDRTT